MVEGARLEIVCAERYRGFESLPLRHVVLPTSARETRQAWKGATVAVSGVWRGLSSRRATTGEAESPAPCYEAMITMPGKGHHGSLKRITRFWILPLVVTSCCQGPSRPAGAQPATNPQGEAPDDGVVVIDAPPTPSPSTTETTVPSDELVLQRPGQVLLSGKPVRLDFRSPTEGVSFQLLAGGAYSSISGVSYGAGYGGFGGWGYGGWGYGGYGFGMAPYYGEVLTRAYQPICEAPCEATLLSGKHRMALSLQGGAPVNVAQPVNVTENAIVEGRYVDRRRIRKIGWAVFVSGAVAGIAMMFASVDYRYDPLTGGSQIRNRGVFYSGVGIFVGSIITGSVLASRDDEAYIDVRPSP